MDANWLGAIGFYSAILTAVAGFALALIQFRISHYPTDRRTKVFKNLRFVALIFLVASGLGTIVSTYLGKSQTGKILAELEEQKGKNAMSGTFKSGQGFIGEVQIGKKGAVFSWDGQRSLLDVFTFGLPIYAKVSAENSVFVRRSLNGDLSVSARICDENGLVSEIVNNDWLVGARPRIWDRNYSSNALEIIDANGAVVFQVELAGGKTGITVCMQGFFYDSEGNGMGFVEDPSGGSEVWKLYKTNGFSNPFIKPLFKYPSEQHLGKYADDVANMVGTKASR
jgi:hypothetical protein